MITKEGSCSFSSTSKLSMTKRCTVNLKHVYKIITDTIPQNFVNSMPHFCRVPSLFGNVIDIIKIIKNSIKHCIISGIENMFV